MVHACSIQWWKVFSWELPRWGCSEDLIFPQITNFTPVTPIMNYPIIDLPFQIEMLFLLCAGILGILLVELMSNKFGYLIDPIVMYTRRRYSYVQVRNRLNSMKGHP